MKKPVENKYYGCCDGDTPEWYSEYELSRVYDILYSTCLLEDIICDVQSVWNNFPDTLRAEFNYCKWKYLTA